MPGEFKNSHHKTAGSILAAALVSLLGAMGIAFIVAGGGGDPVLALVLVGGFLTTLTCVVWFLNRLTVTTAKDCYNWVFSKKARPEKEYTPQRKDSRSAHYGDNRPASAEDVKDLKDGLRNWVPSNSQGSRSKLR